MNRATWLQDRRMLKFRDVLSRWERRELSMMEAGELLGMSERQFRRYRERFEEEGEAGLVDRRLGKPSPRRIEAAATDWGQAMLAPAPDYRALVAAIGEANDDEARVRLVHRAEGLHSFASLISRTRRRDIGTFTTRQCESDPSSSGFDL